MALAVVGCDHPARKLDHRAGDLLVLRKLVDGGDRRGGSRAEARERQRQRTKKGPDRGVCAQATNRAAFGPAPVMNAPTLGMKARIAAISPSTSAIGTPSTARIIQVRKPSNAMPSNRSEEHTSELQSLMRTS